MQHPSLKDNFRRVVIEAEELALELNRSLDAYEQARGEGSTRRELLELGLLLGSIRRGRYRAEELSRSLPSPNQVPESVAAHVAAVGNSLFAFIDSCRYRESLVGRLAEQVQDRAA